MKNHLIFYLSISYLLFATEGFSNELIEDKKNIKEHESYLESRHNNIFKNSELSYLNDEIFKNIAKEQISGIWKNKNDENVIIVLNNGLYEHPPTREMKKLRKYLKKEKHQVTFTDEIIDPTAYIFSDNNIKIINLSDKFFTFKYPKLVNEHTRPFLYKHQNEFIVYHEYAHIKERQEATLRYWKQMDKNFDEVLIREIDSDLYGLFILSKNNNFNQDEFIKLLNELSSLREHAMYHDFNLGHATHFALNTMKKIILENDNLYDKIKKQEEQNIQNITTLFAFESIRQLDLGYDKLSTVDNWDLSYDLSIKMNNKNEEYKLIKKLKNNKNNYEGIYKIINYEIFLENVSSEYTEYKGYYKTILPFSKLYLKNINQFILLDSYKEIITTQTLKNILNNT